MYASLFKEKRFAFSVGNLYDIANHDQEATFTQTHLPNILIDCVLLTFITLIIMDVISVPELANSIENTIAIAFLSTIAIAIAIDKGIFQLLLLLLIRASSNY